MSTHTVFVRRAIGRVHRCNLVHVGVAQQHPRGVFSDAKVPDRIDYTVIRRNTPKSD